MARYISSSCKISRRIGTDLFLKSLSGRDITTKCKLKVFPGQHGNKRKKMASNYSLQLAAKQMIKYMYGIMEKQLKHVYKSISCKKGATGILLLKTLESRLDNLVYRMGFASTRAEARQLVSHKSIIVTYDKKSVVVNIPSFIVKPGSIIKVREKSKNQIRIQNSLTLVKKNGFVLWVDVSMKDLEGLYLRYPERKELPNEINEQLVVELYSK